VCVSWRRLNLEKSRLHLYSCCRHGPLDSTASGERLSVADANANTNTAPIMDAPVMSPRLRDRLSMPETVLRWSGRVSVMTAVLLAVWSSA
jgi:hypothetical protein